jgi:hypothetical protein
VRRTSLTLLLLCALPTAAGPTRRGWQGAVPEYNVRDSEHYPAGDADVVSNCKVVDAEKRKVDCKHRIDVPGRKKTLHLKGGERVLESGFQGGFLLYDEGCCGAPNQGHFYARDGEFLGYAVTYEAGEDFGNVAGGFLLVDLRERSQWKKPHQWFVLVPDLQGKKPLKEPLTLDITKPGTCEISMITAFRESAGAFTITYRQANCESSGDYEGTCTRGQGQWTCKVTVPPR